MNDATEAAFPHLLFFLFSFFRKNWLAICHQISLFNIYSASLSIRPSSRNIRIYVYTSQPTCVLYIWAPRFDEEESIISVRSRHRWWVHTQCSYPVWVGSWKHREELQGKNDASELSLKFFTSYFRDDLRTWHLGGVSTRKKWVLELWLKFSINVS